MRRRPFGADAWLGLVPEIERLAPALVARIEGDGAGLALRIRIERLIRAGDADAWMELLRDLGDRYADRAGGDDAALTLAEILRDQYRLAPGVLEMAPRDEEASALLEQGTGR